MTPRLSAALRSVPFVLLAAVLTLGLAACSGDSPAGKPTASTASPTPEQLQQAVTTEAHDLARLLRGAGYAVTGTGKWFRCANRDEQIIYSADLTIDATARTPAAPRTPDLTKLLTDNGWTIDGKPDQDTTRTLTTATHRDHVRLDLYELPNSDILSGNLLSDCATVPGNRDDTYTGRPGDRIDLG